MEFKTFSQFPSADPIQGDELVPIVQSGKNKKVPVNKIMGMAQKDLDEKLKPLADADTALGQRIDNAERLGWTDDIFGVDEDKVYVKVSDVNVHGYRLADTTPTLDMSTLGSYTLYGTDGERRKAATVQVSFAGAGIMERYTAMHNGAEVYMWSVEHCRVSVDGMQYTGHVQAMSSKVATDDKGFEVVSGPYVRLVAEDTAPLKAELTARHEQTGVSVFDAVIDEFKGGYAEVNPPQRLTVSTHYEIIFDRKQGRFMLSIHEVESHPDQGDGVLNWKAWSDRFVEIPRYEDFYRTDDERKGDVRTDRVYQCQGRLYRYDGSALTEIGAKEALFIDQWLNRGNYGTKQYSFYDASKGDTPYGIEELWVSYKEVLTILSIPCLGLGDATTNAQWFMQFSGRKLRAMFPIVGGLAANLRNFFGIYSNPGLEMVRILDYYNRTSNDTPANATNISDTYRAFCTCRQLRKWLGYYKISADSSATHFYDADWPNLEELWLIGLRKNIQAFKTTNKIKYECLRFMIDNAANTAPITVTVHIDIWDALCGGGAPQNDNGGTADEWTQLMIDASAKNISFASA